MRVRFSILGAVSALAIGCALSAARAEDQLWRFDNVERIGGFKATVEGNPRIVDSPFGPAVWFDGTSDSLLIDGRPLIGAQQFTVEILIRPDGGAREQRFLHIAETDPVTGQDAPPAGQPDRTPRIMFETRVEDGHWYPDAYLLSSAGSKALIFPEKRFPLGRWYALQQTYDGKLYRLYVDGELQGEGEVALAPHGPGRVRAGARMNGIDYFMGAISMARFTDRVLSTEEFLSVESLSE